MWVLFFRLLYEQGSMKWLSPWYVARAGADLRHRFFACMGQYFALLMML
jgi:hypothetical protein